MSESTETIVQRVSVRLDMNCLFRILVTSVLLYQVSGRPVCKEGMYYDSVTNNCDPCSDICEYSEAQKTTVECRTKCPGYGSRGSRGLQRESMCPPQQYYDENVNRCDSCDSVCVNAEGEVCRRLCPEWPGITQTTTYGQDESTKMNLHALSLANVVVTYTPAPVIVLACIVVVTAAAGFCVLIIHLTRRKMCFWQPQQAKPDHLTGEGNPLTQPEDDRHCENNATQCHAAVISQPSNEM
ncbi:uncharacterized protein LOC124152019 [Haliotis rufescens]|uniref:uncharacterized protein LOC124152019 n=1 Tax=Haliotis rufescens TaxID=6454 RepID=UPI00201EFB20|nr:uncharacterized protein LOC124152019 [Haliotis rufescens]